MASWCKRGTLLIMGLAAVMVMVASTAANSRPLAGKIIFCQGQVAIKKVLGQEWTPASINQDLFEGDIIQTGPTSRAAILCLDESQIRLNENTILLLKNIAPSPRLSAGEAMAAADAGRSHSNYQVPQGELWLRNKNDRFRFELETPAVSCGIRGTEFNLRVAADGFTHCVMLEGQMSLTNRYGSLVLSAGEEGLTQPGQAPTKRLLVQPQDAVQWALYYPGFLSYRDIPLAGGEGSQSHPANSPASTSLLQQAETAYDQGRLEEAEKQAAEVLAREPQNPKALTVMGWICLQRHQPHQAREFFQQIPKPQELAVIGLALSLYRSGKATEAYDYIKTAGRQLRPTPLLTAMTGYLALMIGRVGEARTSLATAMAQAPGLALPRALLAQIFIVQNRKDAARTEAARALAENPSSPLAHLTMALVEMACFDPKRAAGLLERALTLDQGFVDAHVYLARVWLGGDYLDRAWHTIQKALALAPEEAEVLSLAGFVRLGFRDYREAEKFFHRASKANPGLGEPHLGLGQVHFRYRRFDRGLMEILTATLLEPRVSLYQSFVGKALYQVRAFNRSLEVYDYAKTLDPNDPTPYLYKGIALADLYRPGEAVQEYNKSIALNDNLAVFRTRLMLDRDLAVRNTSLARAYTDLGLDAWAQSKALTAVKYDPTNSAAQLFFSGSYRNDPQRQPAAYSADLFYRLLAPANQNTFMMSSPTMADHLSKNYTPDYTPMFEMPYFRVPVETTAGVWDGAKSFYNVYVEPYGGLPGLGFRSVFGYGHPVFSGLRVRNSQVLFLETINLVKWDPTPKDSLFASFEYDYHHGGDNGGINDTHYQNHPYFNFQNRGRAYELGYVHRFGPNATFLGYVNFQNWKLVETSLYADRFLYGGIPVGLLTHLDRLGLVNFFNLQGQQQLILGPHTLMVGADYLNGQRKIKFWGQEMYFIGGNPVLSLPLNIQNVRRPIRSSTVYVMDYWRLRPNLLLEVGLFWETVSAPLPRGNIPTVNESRVNPRVGLNWQVNAHHTLRLGWSRHLDTHQDFLQAFLQPPDVAGFTWQISSTIPGSRSEYAWLAWESQWNDRTFSRLTLERQRKTTPNFDWGPEPFDWVNQRYLGAFVVNRIVTPSFGLAVGAMYKYFDDNWPGPINYDFSEVTAFSRLAWVHRTGWRFSLEPFFMYQNLKYRRDTLFGLVNLSLRKDLPNKRGYLLFRVDNLFDTPFNYEPDLPLGVITPKRRFLGVVNLQF